MTKEQVAIDNGGGGNWGAEWGGDIKQINTIDAPVVSLSTSLLPVLHSSTVVAEAAALVGETKSNH